MKTKKKPTAAETREIFRNNVFKSFEILSKGVEEGFLHAAGIDPSLTASAVSVEPIDTKGEYVNTKADKMISSRSPDIIRSEVANFSRPWRMERTQKYIRQSFKKTPALLAAIEGYAHMSMFNRELLGEVTGGIKLNVFWRHPELVWSTIFVSPGQLKKFVMDAGAAKEMVILGVFKNWGREVIDNNEADAVVLGRLARTLAAFAFKYGDPSGPDYIGSYDEKQLRDFYNRGWDSSFMSKRQWEVVISIYTKRMQDLFEYRRPYVKDIINENLNLSNSKKENNREFKNKSSNAKKEFSKIMAEG